MVLTGYLLKYGLFEPKAFSYSVVLYMNIPSGNIDHMHVASYSHLPNCIEDSYNHSSCEIAAAVKYYSKL